MNTIPVMDTTIDYNVKCKRHDNSPSGDVSCLLVSRIGNLANLGVVTIAPWPIRSSIWNGNQINPTDDDSRPG